MHDKSLMLELKEVNMKLFKAVAGRYKKLGLDITPVHSRIIMFLYDSDKEVCQKDIEKYVSCNKSTISAILNTMERNNLIKRIDSQKDSRCKVIILTDLSLSIAKCLRNDMKSINEVLKDNINVKEYDLFCQTLNKIKNNIERI